MDKADRELAELRESLDEITLYRKFIIWLTVACVIFYVIYKVAVFTSLEAHVLDWMNLIVRWAHVILGISWIGASFYFIFLENSLNRTENIRDELAGNLWAIHGGGFYYVEKYKVAPAEVPKHLHWFKYEAYFTWLTGFMLLAIVYYFNAKSYMIDSRVADISESTAIAIGIATLLGGWLIYDLMCRTSLLQRKTLFALIGFTLLIVISFVLSKFLSGRAAFIHVGALLGTIMAGNVFFVIIPSQKALVKAARLKLPLDPTLGKLAGLRSLHNNYMTLPVIFVMISHHFPSTFGHGYNWAILAGLTLASVAVRHYINLYEQGKKALWIMPFAVLALISLVMVTSPTKTKIHSSSTPVHFSEIHPIVQQRCQPCHSAHPTDPDNPVAAAGIQFDTPEQIKNLAERIMVRAVQTATMPQANKTAMTQEERELLGHWIQQGAELNN